MKIIIDRLGCTGCAECWESCPEIFEENEHDGLVQLSVEYRDLGYIARGEAPDTLVTPVEDVAEECPAEVIHVFY